MLFPAANIGDLQIRLLLIRPDFQPEQGRPIEISHRFDTNIGEGRTTIEERRPGRRAMLLTQTCTLLLQGHAADDWRKGEVALGPRPVGVPLWIDALPPADWAERIYDAKKIVGFDAESGAFAIYDGPNLPAEIAFPLYAPLLIGRWKERPPARAKTSDIGYATVAIAEASPWTCRIRPHSHGTGWTAWPEPDHEDTSDHGLEYIRLSAAREPGLDRINAAARWKQGGHFRFPSRLAIRQHLTHFEAARGAHEAWGPLPAWFQPGADTEATPDDYTVRFASDTLTLTYTAGHVAEADVAFIQELDTPGRDQSLPGEFHLYKLEYQHDLAHPELFTDCDEPAALPEGTYAPRQIGHQEIRRSLKPQDDKASIELEFVPGSLAHDWLRGRLFGWVLLTVWKYDPDDPDGTRGAPLYVGFVANVSPSGNTFTIEATLFGKLLKERAPADVFGRQCNTYVFSPRCGLPEAAFRSEGTVARADLAADGRSLTVRDAAGWGGPAYADNWFAQGLLRCGAGRLGTETPRIVVTILRSAMESGNLVLQLARPLWPDMLAIAGQTIQLVPGCGRQYGADCGEKFGNQINFKGFEFVPDFIEQTDPGAPKTPKK